MTAMGPAGTARTPIVWSVSGLDSGGGAGLTADQRAADAAGVHLCPVAAALTAQNSVAVQAVLPVPAEGLDAQLAALADDLPPAAIKTGLLGNVANLRVLVRWVDRLRERGPLALIVDPVLGASTGASFANAELLAAYRDELLPRASVVTPNRREAARLLGWRDAGGADARGPTGAEAATEAGADAGTAAVPAMARALIALGAGAVVVTGGDGEGVEGGVDSSASVDGGFGAGSHGFGAGSHGFAADRHAEAEAEADQRAALDWCTTPQASGWLALPRRATRHTHGTGCCFATGLAAAMARGFVEADAVVLAKMLTTSGLHDDGPSPGAGAGPVRPRSGFIRDASLLPWWSDDERPPASLPAWRGAPGEPLRSCPPAIDGVYGITDSGAHAAALFAAGLRTVQLRLKRGDGEAAEAWTSRLRGHVVEAREAARRAGATLIVNDHWRDALALGVDFVHLGQEDLLALDEAARGELQVARARGLRLGVSSHSLWELARAAAWQADCVACGPVWPTLTKAMPWRPQGLDNLGWWVAMSPAPVVGIGGVLEPQQLAAVAAAGAAAGCVVRGLKAGDARAVAAWLDAWREGMAQRAPAPDPAGGAAWPHPSLGG